ncbi:MAG TPA: hypothetical protein VHN78_14160, partial [Chloroflexota bacterium]|nr:hypothetical protein [Chloroflexota bacterium]
MGDGMAQETREVERRGERRHETERADLPPDMDVRDEDLEPHEGLRYIARLFKLLAVLLVLLLIGEIVLGLIREGNSAIPTLLVEATRIIVFAGLLWGAADLALMLIESNHDLRATRILVGRLNGMVARLESALAPRGGDGLGTGRQAARPETPRTELRGG